MIPIILVAAAAAAAASLPPPGEACHRSPRPSGACEAKDGRPAPARLRSGSSLEALISVEDYPAAASRAEVGDATTSLLLTIGVEGRITDCRVTRSSGAFLLDTAACRILVRRAAFWPAVDSRGRPRASVVAHDVRWVMPPPIPQPRFEDAPYDPMIPPEPR
jgi:protein TonB